MSNQGGVYTWSQVANNNAGADNTLTWAEGQAPSTINNSARAMMASTAKYRDDIAGAIVTGGISTAYTISSFQQFDSLADMNGMEVWFTPHTTNGATVTLNVDSLGAKPLRTAPNTELLAGVIIQGTPYGAVYNNTDGAWYLKGYFGQPYMIPLGGIIDYVGTTAPNSQFVLPYGQAISRTTYAALWAMLSTTFGAGDGSTTFNVPDLRGRVAAGADNMGGSAAGRLSSTFFGGATFGNTGGSDHNSLSSTAQLPQFTPSGTITNGAITAPNAIINSSGSGGNGAIVTATGGGANANLTTALDIVQASSSFNGNAVGSATPSGFATVQPTIVLNKILRVI